MSFSFPPGSVIIRFGIRTPFWTLSLSHGTFEDPDTRITFVSPDHYIGYNMLATPEHRQAVLESPSGYIANKSLLNIVASNPSAVADDWRDRREDVLRRALTLKYEQNEWARRRLLSTKDRAIFDDSRLSDLWMCVANGQGQNAHGQALEEIRVEMHNKYQVRRAG